MLNGAMGAIAVQLAGVTSVFHQHFVIGTRSDCDLVLYDQDASPYTPWSPREEPAGRLTTWAHGKASASMAGCGPPHCWEKAIGSAWETRISSWSRSDHP